MRAVPCIPRVLAPTGEVVKSGIEDVKAEATQTRRSMPPGKLTGLDATVNRYIDLLGNAWGQRLPPPALGSRTVQATKDRRTMPSRYGDSRKSMRKGDHGARDAS